ncbi:piggyBac transposable element-derived protein 4-like [Melanaphis sacchari]|uniref:piggyBac transposable element-derived protein 4-like n=1 Tax=Melanaphis sacchari TaxID=742174 RepID=UPI000DC14569|nr:piggyBac transposable element-derived protein 4-like [Melanaphis sacchari]
MNSRSKRARLNDDLINQILEIDNSSNSSEFSNFDDTDEDATYNPNSSESDVESDVEESINNETLDSSPISSSNTTGIAIWNDVTVEKMIHNFQNVMEPDEHLAIDETMVPFCGRLGFRQYIPGKSHKYGVKLFKLCGTDGYTYNVQIYAGKSQVEGKGLACKVVLNLCQMYLNANRKITTDNFYTSLPLAYELLKNKTHLTGTLRSNRVRVPGVTDAKLKRGEIVGKENADGIVIGKWKDKQDVTMLSTRHGIDMIDMGKKNRINENVVKPEIIISYNKGKAGIDLSDQLSSYSTAVRKSIRWYH